MKGLEDWIERQSTAARIVVRVGTRGSLQQVGVICIEGSGYEEKEEAWAITWAHEGEVADTVRSMAEDAGYPDELPRLRLDPFTKSGRRLNSKQWTATKRTEPTDSVGSAVKHLAEGMLGMASELRRANADLCRTIQYEREYAAFKTEEADAAKEAAHEADAYATAMEMIAQDDDTEDPLRKSAGELIAGIGPALTKAFTRAGPLPTAEEVRKWAAENPDWMETLAKDSSLQEMFIQGFMSENPGEEEHPIED